MSEKGKKSRMGDGNPVNFSILQSTAPGAAAVEPQQKAQNEAAPDAPPTPKSVKPVKPVSAAKAATPVKVGGAKQAPAPGVTPKKKEVADSENPFGYAVGPTWPLVGYDKPFLVPTAEDQGRAAAALSIRIPLDLNRTVELHCAKLGVKNLSEWVREAMARQLALEQQHLSKK
jgi:hypothetical protein